MKINIINQATTPLGTSINDLVDACQWYVTNCLKPTWGVDAEITAVEAVDPTVATIQLLDTSDVDGALGYHDLENNLPVGKVFVKTAIENGETLSSTLTHELAELLVDPFCESLVVDNNTGIVYPYEVCDAVEEDTFPAPNGVLVSNFVLPTWFQGWNTKAGQYDYLSKLTKPFQLDAGGYITAIQEGQMQTLWGSEAKKIRWQKESRKGHRLEELFHRTAVKAGLID